MRAPERAAEEIRRVANEPWCVGIYLSAHMEDKLLDHPAFHPIWQACVETDLPACFHGGTARPPYGMGTFEMGNNLFIQHSATNPFEVMRGIASIVGGGVLDIFPKLRVAFLEAGVGWLPFWMERLDEHYELMPEYVPFLKRKPSEVIRSENFFISCDPDEETLPYVVETVGARAHFVCVGLPALRRPIPAYREPDGGPQGVRGERAEKNPARESDAAISLG